LVCLCVSAACDHIDGEGFSIMIPYCFWMLYRFMEDQHASAMARTDIKTTRSFTNRAADAEKGKNFSFCFHIIYRNDWQDRPSSRGKGGRCIN
jgi:hypothetical protein